MPSDGQAASLLAAVAVAASVVVGVAFALFKSSPGDKGANETAQARSPQATESVAPTNGRAVAPASAQPSASATNVRATAAAPMQPSAPATNGRAAKPMPTKPSGPAAAQAAPTSAANSVSGSAAGGTGGDAAAKPAASGAVGGTGGAAVLAQLRQQRDASAAAAKRKADEAAARASVTILFASQTGTAEEIAHSMYDEATSKGLKADVASMNDWKFENITPAKTPVLVVVAASTGDGDPPDNSSRCVLAMKKTAGAGQLKGVKFTVLGLGDSNYTKFMEVSRVIKRKLIDLGAVEFYDCGEADEVDGLEEIVDAWKDGMWEPLVEAAAPELESGAAEANAGGQAAESLPEDYTKEGKLLDADAAIQGVPAPRVSRVDVKLSAPQAGGAEGGAADTRPVEPTAEQLAYRDDTGHYSEEKPFWAKLKETRLLTSQECQKRVLHVAFDVSGAGMRFSAGDSFTVHPANDRELVRGLLKHLGADGSQKVLSVSWNDGTVTPDPLPHLHLKHTLEHNLLWACDLTSPPSKALLVALAAAASDPKEAATLRYLASRDGRAAYKTDIVAGRPSLLQLLQRYASCKPAIGRLLELLSPLRPRQYSLSNAEAASPDTLECAFHVVEYKTHWGAHTGVATTWLERQAVATGGAERYPVSLRPTTGFRPPEDPAAPIIMIGPGTGVAPFRGFLQQRRAQKEAGETMGESWLFFGNWREDWDFLYKDELLAFEADGTLSHLSLAWSRASDKKVYVQDKMAQQGESLCEAILERGAHVFVCGDGMHMAADVQAAIKGILQKHGDMDGQEADDVLRDMAAEKRYMKDVWT